MARSSDSGEVREWLEETFGASADVRQFTSQVEANFRLTFPLMTKLLDAAGAFRFNTRHGTRHLLRWRAKRGGFFGWVCDRRKITWAAPKQVLREHRLVYETIGAIEERLGPPARLPLGSVQMFGVPRFAGLGEDTGEQYLHQLQWVRSTSFPVPESFVEFGAEANGDTWVYTPKDRRVYQIVFGGGPIAATGLSRVKATPLLYYVRRARTFNEFVEFFAERHLRILKQ